MRLVSRLGTHWCVEQEPGPSRRTVHAEGLFLRCRSAGARLFAVSRAGNWSSAARGDCVGFQKQGTP